MSDSSEGGFEHDPALREHLAELSSELDRGLTDFLLARRGAIGTPFRSLAPASCWIRPRVWRSVGDGNRGADASGILQVYAAL